MCESEKEENREKREISHNVSSLCSKAGWKWAVENVLKDTDQVEFL